MRGWDQTRSISARGRRFQILERTARAKRRREREPQEDGVERGAERVVAAGIGDPVELPAMLGPEESSCVQHLVERLRRADVEEKGSGACAEQDGRDPCPSGDGVQGRSALRLHRAEEEGRRLERPRAVRGVVLHARIAAHHQLRLPRRRRHGDQLPASRPNEAADAVALHHARERGHRMEHARVRRDIRRLHVLERT
jgi:hypothetical protein